MQKKLNFSVGITIFTLAAFFGLGLLMLQININSPNTCIKSNPEEDPTHVNAPWQC